MKIQVGAARILVSAMLVSVANDHALAQGASGGALVPVQGSGTPGARLVHCLAEGLTIKESADRLGIELETVRKRLKVIFQKTDTHRQADLVRLALLCAPPAGGV